MKVKIKLPTYYGVDVEFYEENGKYYMHVLEWTNDRTEISEEFYDVAVKEFSTEKEWQDMRENEK